MAFRPRERVWVVRAGDGATLADILKRAGGEPNALVEGRVFVGKRRASRSDQAVRIGDVVRIGGARATVDPSALPVEILFVEDGLVACAKPAGLPTVPDHAGSAHALVALVAKTIGVGADTLRVTSRLDRDVSGVVVFALDAAAETRLRDARAEGTYHRRYLALAIPAPAGERGSWTAAIGRAADPRLRAARGPDAKLATTYWRKVAVAELAIDARFGGASVPRPDVGGASDAGAARSASSVALCAVDPVTGRTHQIRVHASDAGSPLIGDRDYGGPARLVLGNGRILAPSRIALHAARVVVPGLTRTLEARAPVPPALSELWSALGGAADAWDVAIAADTDVEGQPWRPGSAVG